MTFSTAGEWTTLLSVRAAPDPLCLCDAHLENVTMEVLPTATCDSANWSQQFAVSLSSQRTRVGELLAALQQKLDAAKQREAAVTAELTALRDEHQQVVVELTRLREAETHRRDVEPSPAAPSADAAAAERDDYVRRYEMAMEDLRQLQAQNTELQQQLSTMPAARPQPSVSPSGALDWEAEKQRVLAALEAGALGDEEGARNDRLKIEEVVRTTEQVVAHKDQEIADLKHLLRDQSCSLESVAVGAAALGQMLDDDAIVRGERENLKRLQDEWREKLREAEVDISVARAKLARERAELEEKLHLLKEQTPGSPAETGASKAGKPVRGRWLTRLGLKEGGENVRPSGEG